VDSFGSCVRVVCHAKKGEIREKKPNLLNISTKLAAKRGRSVVDWNMAPGRAVGTQSAALLDVLNELRIRGFHRGSGLLGER
jgi:hypothetical protein